MTIEIAIIGCGKWSDTIQNCINRNANYKFKFLVCRNKTRRKIYASKDIEIFNTVDDLLKIRSPKAIYIAGDPRTNYSIIKKVSKLNIQCIVEKPLSLNLNEVNKLKKFTHNNNNKIYLNLPHLNDKKFLKLKSIIFQKKILKVNIIEGSYGPFRKNIDPIWDWGVHPLSTIFFLFKYEECNKYQINKVINLKSKKNYKINFYFKKINIKILTGNAFKKKIRRIKFYYSNNNFIMYDFDKKFISSSNIFYNKINSLNKLDFNTPLDNLLNIFSKNYISKKQLKIFNCGIYAVKFLNRYFKTF